MTAENKCEIVKEFYSSLMKAERNTAIYVGEQMYFVKNILGEIVLVKERSERDAKFKANMYGETE